MRFDLHSHTRYSSDGLMAPSELLASARRKGLDGIAVTDHNTIRGGLETAKLAGNGFKVIVGAEIMTGRGEVIGLFLNEEVRPGTLGEVVDRIRAQGGIAVAPHPFDGVRSRTALWPAGSDARLLDAVEAFNSRCVLAGFNRAAAEFAEKHGLAITAGSDAHFAGEVGNAGISIDESDVRKAILKRRVRIFGKKSPAAYFAATKALKVWRRLPAGLR